MIPGHLWETFKTISCSTWPCDAVCFISPNGNIYSDKQIHFFLYQKVAMLLADFQEDSCFYLEADSKNSILPGQI
jgi:hypothetical protein